MIFLLSMLSESTFPLLITSLRSLSRSFIFSFSYLFLTPYSLFSLFFGFYTLGVEFGGCVLSLKLQLPLNIYFFGWSYE